jgi:hypothetical protein
MNRKSGAASRPQVTAYVSLSLRKWLDDYVRQFGLDRSEAVRMLIERERRVRWLEAAFYLPTDDLHSKSSARKVRVGRRNKGSRAKPLA